MTSVRVVRKWRHAILDHFWPPATVVTSFMDDPWAKPRLLQFFTLDHLLRILGRVQYTSIISSYILHDQVNTVTSLLSDQIFSQVYYCSRDHFLCHHQKDYCFPYRINWKPMGGGPDSIVATRDIRFLVIHIFHYVLVMRTFVRIEFKIFANFRLNLPVWILPFIINLGLGHTTNMLHTIFYRRLCYTKLGLHFQTTDFKDMSLHLVY